MFFEGTRRLNSVFCHTYEESFRNCARKCKAWNDYKYVP